MLSYLALVTVAKTLIATTGFCHVNNNGTVRSCHYYLASHCEERVRREGGICTTGELLPSTPRASNTGEIIQLKQELSSLKQQVIELERRLQRLENK